MRINIPQIVEPYLPYAAAVVLIFLFIFMALWVWGLLIEAIEARSENSSQPPTETAERMTKAEMARLEKHIKEKVERKTRETQKNYFVHADDSLVDKAKKRVVEKNGQLIRAGKEGKECES